jgi:hypothetical protein
MRCLHEAQLHDDNCFITLTFSPEEIAKRENPYSLDVRDFQLFMKRLRKHFKSKKIRFYHCGEYGEKYGRPHYHAILFGIDFPDKVLHTVNNGNRLYVSETLQKLWPYGYSSIGDMTFESAAYVARYCMKKITGDAAEEHYAIIDSETGEYLGQKKPEYATMSRRPGIAAGWFDKYKGDVYPKDYLTLNGKKMRPPKFYDRYLEKLDPIEHEAIKDRRSVFDAKRAANTTTERLKVREKVLKAKSKQLVRTLD